MATISFQNQKFIYEIQRKARKRLTLELFAPNNFLVKAPLTISDSDIIDFIKKRESWFLEKNRLIKERQSLPEPTFDTIPFMGKRYRLAAVQSRNKPSIKIAGETLQINLYSLSNDQLQTLLFDWYLQQCADYLKMRTIFWSKRLEVFVKGIAIKDQKTRWGSCSSLGNINYNWRLIMAPPEVIDYIVIHEMSHRLILNHSKEFWDIVAQHCPDHQLHKDWLKAHGRELFNFSVYQVTLSTK